MALIGTLTSGISALKTFSKGLDVIGNNIANVNTTGYKSSSASFADTFSNTLRASSTGTSAMQVGTGVQLAGISANYTQGSLSSTGNGTDLAISGNGYFVVRNPADGQLFATRAGNFRIDEQGYLVSANGLRVQGATGGTASLPPSSVGNLRLKTSAEITAEWASNNATAIHDTEIARDAADGAATALNALVTSNAGAATAADVLTSIQAARDAAVTATTAAQTASDADPADQALRDALILAKAESDALSDAYTTAQAAQGTGTPAEQLANVQTSLSNSAALATTAVVAATTAATAAATPSDRASFSIDKLGNVVETYGNGSSVITGRILLQNFSDPSALMKEGNNMYSGFAAAGPIGGTSTLSSGGNAPGTSGLGTIQAGTLELSNVDLTEQFSELITTQRSFQAGSRLITVSDSVLEDIVNLKR